ncbi:hypothetical protein CCACVL1_05538 [Corchorus capsularis]|uniref:Uncharacterized protein n=1 Tax=Corchorus capsularis TaxID=210143 RepID=A0A1R3JK53_COCAP|nr:hypothetical protein CCACVL1_05538 [Corchorus capsularis]
MASGDIIQHRQDTTEKAELTALSTHLAQLLVSFRNFRI